MSDLKLELGCFRSDRTSPLFESLATIEGVELECASAPLVSDIFARMVRDREFDLAELGLTFYLRGLDLEDSPFVALPVFRPGSSGAPRSSSTPPAVSRSRRISSARPSASSRPMGTTPACGRGAYSPTTTGSPRPEPVGPRRDRLVDEAVRLRPAAVPGRRRRDPGARGQGARPDAASRGDRCADLGPGAAVRSRRGTRGRAVVPRLRASGARWPSAAPPPSRRLPSSVGAPAAPSPSGPERSFGFATCLSRVVLDRPARVLRVGLR